MKLALQFLLAAGISAANHASYSKGTEPAAATTDSRRIAVKKRPPSCLHLQNNVKNAWKALIALQPTTYDQQPNQQPNNWNE